MFEVMARLLMNKQIKFSDGELVVMGARDCFTPAITYVETLKALTNAGKEYLIYSSAKKAGYDWFSNMSKYYPGMKQTEAINWGVKLISLSGWGIPRVENLDIEKKTTVFTLTNSITAKLYGHSDFPVDHLFRGLVAGGGSFILKDNLDSIETHCAAKGDGICRFVVAPKSKLNVSGENQKLLFGGEDVSQL